MTTRIDFVAEAPPLRQEEDGTIRVGQTRVTLDTVIHALNQRMSAEEIVRAFSTLDLADVYLTIGFYLRHRREVDRYLAEREREAEDLRQMIQRESPQDGLRERLLARLAERSAHPPVDDIRAP